MLSFVIIYIVGSTFIFNISKVRTSPNSDLMTVVRGCPALQVLPMVFIMHTCVGFVKLKVSLHNAIPEELRSTALGQRRPLVDHSLFHHEIHVLKNSDVVQGIT